MTKNVKILVVEDEFSISKLIQMSLEQSGYRCECVYSGDHAATMIEETYFDLILLDVMLPGINGFELIEYIKEYNIPVIFITAKSEVKDRVKGLKLGAEDYIIKPFDVSELLARVEVVLRRTKKQDAIVQINDLIIDMEARTVKKDGNMIDLTWKEFEILLLFLQNKQIALYRETIYERVWGEHFMGDTRTVDLHVQRLRKKIGWEDKIQAVYKIGYRLEE